MRIVAVSTFLVLALFSSGAWGEDCWCTKFAPASVPPLQTEAAVAGDHSTFKGISLVSKPGDVAASSLRDGFSIYADSYVGQPHAIPRFASVAENSAFPGPVLPGGRAFYSAAINRA
jgi:hypothetical protein